MYVFYIEYGICKPHVILVNHTEVRHAYTLELVRPCRLDIGLNRI